jgi:tRNA A37 threonylcarbamoyltransferase TsaD
MAVIVCTLLVLHIPMHGSLRALSIPSHCLLTVAKDVDEFVVLGSTLDDSPGECLDKVKTTTSILLKTSQQVTNELPWP